MRLFLTVCLYFLLVAGTHLTQFKFETFEPVCQTYREGESLDMLNLVGTWITVFIQPSTVNCFILLIRSTTELTLNIYTTVGDNDNPVPAKVDNSRWYLIPKNVQERNQSFLKYGNFSGRVDWSKCLLEVESPLGRHYLQGTSNRSGLLENIIITETSIGKYELHEQNANQWSMFGRRGSELLLMTDCQGGAVAIFARAPYWPVAEEFYAILHRTGTSPRTVGQVLCEPLDRDAQQTLRHYFSETMSRG